MLRKHTAQLKRLVPNDDREILEFSDPATHDLQDALMTGDVDDVLALAKKVKEICKPQRRRERRDHAEKIVDFSHAAR